jgi:predicted Zn-dependent protease
MANYLRGVEYVKQQNYSAADRIFSRISAVFPAFPYGYYVQGATKFALGQFGAAEKILTEYIRRMPRDPNGTRLIARAALLQHGVARAIDYLRPLAEESPPDPATLTLLGNAYLADEKPEAALQQFDKAITLDPVNAKLKIGRGIAEINRMMLLLDPTSLARGLVRKKVEVLNYPDGGSRFSSMERRSVSRCSTKSRQCSPARSSTTSGCPPCWSRLRRSRPPTRRDSSAGTLRGSDRRTT